MMNSKLKTKIVIAYLLGIPALYFVLTLDPRAVLGQEARKALVIWAKLLAIFWSLRLLFNFLVGFGLGLPVEVLEKTCLFLMAMYLLYTAFRSVTEIAPAG